MKGSSLFLSSTFVQDLTIMLYLFIFASLQFSYPRNSKLCRFQVFKFVHSYHFLHILCVTVRKCMNIIFSMLTDQEIYLCSEFTQKIAPISKKHIIGSIPKNLERVSNDRFIFCDTSTELKKTRMIQMKIKKMNSNTDSQFQAVFEEERVIEQFEGVWTSWGFMQDDYALLINKEGDFLFYNLNSKSIQEAQKQHPGLYYDAEIMHTNEHFVTCGGSFKNQTTNAAERIIKVWQIDNSDCLIQKSRINTGHKKSIQHSFLLNKSKIVSLSSDKTIRITNLLTQQIDSIIQTDIELLSGCQIDYNTILTGGNSKHIKVYDIRDRKLMNVSTKVNQNLVHIVNFTRFTDQHVLVSNINQIWGVDLRNWQLRQLGAYQQGEINSQILTINSSEFVVGNREKSIQLWKAQ